MRVVCSCHLLVDGFLKGVCVFDSLAHVAFENFHPFPKVLFKVVRIFVHPGQGFFDGGYLPLRVGRLSLRCLPDLLDRFNPFVNRQRLCFD
jgi:hypothetical protein